MAPTAHGRKLKQPGGNHLLDNPVAALHITDNVPRAALDLSIDLDDNGGDDEEEGEENRGVDDPSYHSVREKNGVSRAKHAPREMPSTAMAFGAKIRRFAPPRLPSPAKDVARRERRIKPRQRRVEHSSYKDRGKQHYSKEKPRARPKGRAISDRSLQEGILVHETEDLVVEEEEEEEEEQEDEDEEIEEWGEHNRHGGKHHEQRRSRRTRNVEQKLRRELERERKREFVLARKLERAKREAEEVRLSARDRVQRERKNSEVKMLKVKRQLASIQAATAAKEKSVERTAAQLRNKLGCAVRVQKRLEEKVETARMQADQREASVRLMYEEKLESELEQAREAMKELQTDLDTRLTRERNRSVSERDARDAVAEEKLARGTSF